MMKLRSLILITVCYKALKRFEAVTLPENLNSDSGDVEQSIDYSAKNTSMGFQQSAYFTMRLDTIDELTENFMESLREKEPNDQHHQADAANITLDDRFDSFQADTGPYNRFERFDIEGDDETQLNFPSQEHTQRTTTPVHSPPPEMQPQNDFATDGKWCYIVLWVLGKSTTRWGLLKKRLVGACPSCSSASGISYYTEELHPLKPPDVFLLKLCYHDRTGFLQGFSACIQEVVLSVI